IEEEYLLVDPLTRDLADEPPEQLWAECEARLGDLIKPEFLKSQIEVATGVCRSIAEGREDLSRLRKTVAEVAGKHGLAPIAASTHPFSKWQSQHHTDKERYHVLAQDMQAVARRLLICGMHVHVGLDDDEMRIDLMNQASYFLPHILALSTSSPFWQGTDTGLKSYRLSVFDELPRTGLPERFDSYAEYRRHVDVLIKAGTIKDASMLWWDIRPSSTFQTLEMRIPDVCTRLEDTLSIAALFQCIIRMLYRLRRDNQRWRIYANMLINENRWRAQRYGLDDGLLDFGKGVMVPSADLIDELITMVGEDAKALNCTAEIERLRDIVEHGTSAHRQLAVYYQSIEGGMSPQEALNAVVDMLIAETISGL
ncbi:MAG: carboxylate-amine ligase, partial [Rhodospirillales bacterium]|nr:carboxylate-amine ligase [Rhodospirillales bacterium]